MHNRNGVSLIEILIGIVIVIVASIATLTYFAYGMGNVAKQGNRRAALERARERLEQLMETNASSITPEIAEATYWLKPDCSVTPCGWTISDTPPDPLETVGVEDLLGQAVETTVRWVDDTTVTPGIPDTLELGVKVWFTKNFDLSDPAVGDDNFNRVHLRTLRTP